MNDTVTPQKLGKKHRLGDIGRVTQLEGGPDRGAGHDRKAQHRDKPCRMHHRGKHGPRSSVANGLSD